MKTSSEKSPSSHATPATKSASQAFVQKAGAGGFVQPAAPVIGVQAKLTVNEPGDAHEQEADKMADKVVQRLANPAVQKASMPVEKAQRAEEDKVQKAEMPEEQVQRVEEEQVQRVEEDKVQKAEMPEEKVQRVEEEKVQMAEMPEEQVQRVEEEKVQMAEMPEEQVQRVEEEKVQKAAMPEEQVQRAGDSPAAVPEPGADFSSRLQASKGGGSPLAANTRSSMEAGFGADFSNVRVHKSPEAAGMSRDINAQAFTHGSDIYFNEGKYNPGSKDGQHLLAHELTHTMQQGGAQRKEIRRAPAKNQPLPAGAPTKALDITKSFNPAADPAWAAYLAANKKAVAVLVKIGDRYQGTIMVSQKSKPGETGPVKYRLDDNASYLEVKGLKFLDPLRPNVVPVLVLEKFGENHETRGYLSVMTGGKVAGHKGLLESFNQHMEQMGFLGLDTFALNKIKPQNAFENGRLLFSVSGLTTKVGGFLTAGVDMGITGETFHFDAVAQVKVSGVAEGDFNIKRTTEGNLEGRGTIDANIANVQASLQVEFLAGQLTIKGTGTINSEKFSGTLTLLVTDAETADEAVNTELGVQKAEQEAQSPDKKPAPKSTNRVLVGWGTVQATITDWLSGTAKVGIDSKGDVTIVGEMVMPDEVELMEKKGKKITLVSFEIRAGYGVPLVGQVFIFGGIELFMNAGFGPLVLRDVKFSGQYSTKPGADQHFMITGTLGINAFAILGLEASAGVGLTLIGHDIKAGLAVTAAAGIKAYAEATPTFEYSEKGGGKGGAVGEARLKGHFEAAAQLFLMLGGKFFVELDSPWWSPAPDENWDFPLGSVEYPIGDSMGIGADIDWLVGSPDAPELKFSPIEFNPEKFTEDVMADPPPGKGAGGEKDQAGTWTDETGGGNLEENAQTTDKGKDSKNKKEDLSKLTAEQRYMRGLDDISKIADAAKAKPITLKMLEAKIKKVKDKYGLEQAKIKDKSDENANVFVKHAGEDNSKHLLEVPLISEKERKALLNTAEADFKKLLEEHADGEQSISRADAEAIGEKIVEQHYVIEHIEVTDGGKSWDFKLDLGDKSKSWAGKGKREKEEVKEGEGKEGAEVPKEEKEKLVKEGLEALHKEENKYLDNGAIDKENAEEVASAIFKSHPIFTSFIVIDGENTWDYQYTASPAAKIKGSKKSNPIDSAFKDEELRNAIKKVIEEENPKTENWVAIFPAKGLQMKIKANDKIVEATLFDLLGPDRFEDLHITLLEALEGTIILDDTAKEELRKEKGTGFEMTGLRVNVNAKIATITNDIIKNLRSKKLFYIRGTEIPRKLHKSKDSDVVRWNEIKFTFNQDLYREIAYKHKDSYQAKYGEQIHHVVPLYLGGSHEIENLLKVQGHAKKEIAESIHARLHNFVDETTIKLFIEKKSKEEEDREVEVKLEHKDLYTKIGNDLQVLIGTLFDSGQIDYKEKGINMPIKDKKGNQNIKVP